MSICGLCEGTIETDYPHECLPIIEDDEATDVDVCQGCGAYFTDYKAGEAQLCGVCRRY